MINPEMGLRLVLNIEGAGSEKAVVSMDSPDQGAYGIPMQVNYIDSDSLSVKVPQLALSYTGALNGESLSGEFSQGPLKLPLVLSPKVTVTARPQTPVPPFPYITEEVMFQSQLDGAGLYGTLSLPDKNVEETRVVLLVSGSGVQNRDEEIFNHKPFAVIADYLARNGIASLRYDDRGFDKTTGLLPNSTTEENAMDALGGINFLKEKGFNKIGIIGHSEGGLIADILGSDGNKLDFIVQIGGPAVSGADILIFQNEFLLKDGGVPDEYVAMYIDALKGIFESHKEGNTMSFEESEYEIFSTENTANPVVAPLAKNLKDNFFPMAPWVKQFINYDPLQDIKKITVPMLMLYGEKDTQVPPSLNLPALEKNTSGIAIKVYPELNHLMQHCTTGKVTEYAEIEETVSPAVLEDIKSFILSLP